MNPEVITMGRVSVDLYPEQIGVPLRIVQAAARMGFLTGDASLRIAVSGVWAAFSARNGTVYRLAIKGFASQQEAIARCRLLKSRGGSCFVRNVAGDAPLQIASR